MFNIFRKIVQNRHIKYGLPFVGLLLGSSFALSSSVTSFRYEFRKSKKLEREEVEALKAKGIFKRDPNELSLEKLYEEYMEKDYKDDFENKRIPRPWESGENNPLVQAQKANKKVLSVREAKARFAERQRQNEVDYFATFWYLKEMKTHFNFK